MGEQEIYVIGDGISPLRRLCPSQWGVAGKPLDYTPSVHKHRTRSGLLAGGPIGKGRGGRGRGNKGIEILASAYRTYKRQGLGSKLLGYWQRADTLRPHKKVGRGPRKFATRQTDASFKSGGVQATCITPMERRMTQQLMDLLQIRRACRDDQVNKKKNAKVVKTVVNEEVTVPTVQRRRRWRIMRRRMRRIN